MSDFERARDALDAQQSEARIQRMWRNVEASRGAARPKSRVPRMMVLGVAVIASAAALVLALRIVAPTEPVSPHAALPSRIVADGQATRITLSDGSVIALDAGAHIDVIERSPAKVELALRRGKVSFDVKASDTSTWRVDCGAVEIAFVGSALSIARSATDVAVHVRRGAVVARGEQVPDRVQRVLAGSSIRVALAGHEAAHAVPAENAASTPDLDAVPERAAALDEARAEPAPISWRRAAAAGRFQDAYETLGADGLAREVRTTTDAEDLLVLADVARLSGHPTAAVTPLERILALHGGSAHAAIASYSLGQLYLDRLRRPADAAAAYARAIELGLPRSMTELAMARRVEALGRAGSPTVQSAATAYLSHYPDGRYREDVSRWVTP